LLDLCRLVAECLSPAENAGAVACPAFLLDMERVFERYVTAGVVRAFAGSDRYCVAVQPSHHVSHAVAGQPDLVMRPDVTLALDSRTVLVLDAKWKRLGQSPLRTDDVYQVLAYCTALDVRRAVLVYPGRRDCAWTYALTQAPVQLTVRKLRVVGSREACGRSLQRLARRLGTGRQDGDR
jgi:5-methylcytosine-specific restriction enzyme subunit McrC